MHKLVVLACVAAFAAVASAGLVLPHAGYGFVGGLTKLPNLGFGNLASVNHNQNVLGYNLGTVEHGPLSVRHHVQTAHAPLGVGIPVVHGIGLGLGHHGIIG